MIENQEELRTALEKYCEQKEQSRQLETAQTSKQDDTLIMSTQLEALQTCVSGQLGLFFPPKSNLTKYRKHPITELEFCYMRY